VSLDKKRPHKGSARELVGTHVLPTHPTNRGSSVCCSLPPICPPLGADHRRAKGSGTVSARSTHTLFTWVTSRIASQPSSLP
jgi:hypothetical protein